MEKKIYKKFDEEIERLNNVVDFYYSKTDYSKIIKQEHDDVSEQYRKNILTRTGNFVYVFF